jgi:hypothetical protein
VTPFFSPECSQSFVQLVNEPRKPVIQPIMEWLKECDCVFALFRIRTPLRQMEDLLVEGIDCRHNDWLPLKMEAIDKVARLYVVGAAIIYEKIVQQSGVNCKRAIVGVPIEFMGLGCYPLIRISHHQSFIRDMLLKMSSAIFLLHGSLLAGKSGDTHLRIAAISLAVIASQLHREMKLSRAPGIEKQQNNPQP